MSCRDGYCGGCDRCLEAQGYSPEDVPERNPFEPWDDLLEHYMKEPCDHPPYHLVHRWGGVACNRCGKILQEPDDN